MARQFALKNLPAAVKFLLLPLALLVPVKAWAVTYVYTPVNGASDLWASGTDWNNTPVNNSDLQFGTASTVYSAGLTDTNTDNISGALGVNSISLEGQGPLSGGAASITIAASGGDSLNFISSSGNVPVVNLDALAGASGLTYKITSPITLGASTTFQGNGTATFNFAGAISGSNALTKTGSSTLTLSGANTYTGATTVLAGTLLVTGTNTYTGTTSVDAGTLKLDFSAAGAPTTNILNSTANSSALALGGGTVNIVLSSGTLANTQRFNGTTVGAGFSTLAVTQNGNTNAGSGVTLGALARNPGGVVDFTLPTTGSITTTSGTLVSGTNNILVSAAGSGIAFATAGGQATWVTNTSGTLGALGTPSYSTGNGNYTINNDIDVQNGDSVSGVTVNTLRFNAAGDGLTLAGTNTINTGGILNTASGTSSTIGGGTLQSGGGKELVIINNGTLTLNSSIVNSASGASALTLAGSGTTNLNVSNSYTSATTIDGGVVTLGSPTALGSATTASVAFGGNTTGQLNLNGNSVTLIDLTTNASTPGTPIIQNGSSLSAGTLTVNTANTDIYAGVLKDGSTPSLALTKNGAGTLALGGNNTYTGATLVSLGTLQIGIGGATGSLSTSSAISDSGTLAFNRSNTITQGTNFASVISGSGGVTQAGGGTLILSGANTYTGVTIINAGNLSTGASGILANGGPNPSSIGESTNAAANLVLAGGALQYANTGAAESTDRLFTLSASSEIDALGANAITFSGPGSIAFGGTANAAYTLTLGGTGSGVLKPIIADNGSGLTALTVSGGTWTLPVANTFTGVVTISGGILSTGTLGILANGNVASSIGKGAAAAANLVLSGGTLQYLNSGAAETTTRNFTLSGSSAIDASGANSITFSNVGSSIQFGGTANSTYTLTLTGSGVGILDLNLQKNGTGATALTKTGTGTWTIAGGNDTYTGATTISGGTLILGNVSALGNGTNNTSGINLNANSTATLDFAGITPTANPAISITSNYAGNTVFNINNSSGTLVTYTGNITPSAGGNSFTIGSNNGNIALNDQINGAANWTLTKIGSDTVTLGGTADNSFLGLAVDGGTLIFGKTSLTNVHATGGAGLIVNSGGTAQLGGSGNQQIFTGGASITVNSGGTLDFNGQNQDAIAGTLTISGTGVGGKGALINSNASTASGYGTSANLGDGNADVSAPNIVLGATSSIGGAGNLTLYGAISESSSGFGVTKVGAGKLILSGANTFTGGVAINAGTLQLGSAGALNSTVGSQNAVTFGSASTGTLALAGNSVTIANLSTNASPGTTFVEDADGSSVANGTLTVGNSTNASGTYAGTIQNGAGGGTLALAKAGAGTLILSGANTFTGGVSINAGTLQLGSSGALNSTAGSQNAVTFGLSSTGTLSLAGNSVTIANLSTNATPGTTFVQDANASNGTLTVGNSTNASGIYAGTIQDGPGGGTLALIKAGAGSLELDGANTYTGGTQLNAGTLILGANSNLPTSGPIGTGTLILAGGTLTNNGLFTVGNAISVTASTTTNVNAGTSGTGQSLNLTGALTGTGTISNNSALFNNLRFEGDINGFQGTLGYTDYAGGQDLIFNGTTANSMNGSSAHFVLSGDTSGAKGIILGNTSTAGTFQMGDLTGAGGVIGANGLAGEILQIGSLNTSPAAFSGVIVDGITGHTGGTLGVTKVGTGTEIFSGNNTYTGPTTIANGELQLGSNGGLPGNGGSGTPLTIGGTDGGGTRGVLDLNGYSATVSSLNTAGTAADQSIYSNYGGGNSNSPSTLIFNGTGPASTYGGVLSDAEVNGFAYPMPALNLTVAAGTLTLTGTGNSITGTTLISGGTLSISSTGTLNPTSNGGLTINGTGAVFNYNSSTPYAGGPITFTKGTISGTGTIAKAVTSGTNTFLSPGNSPGIQAYTAGLTFANGGTYVWQINNAVSTAPYGTAGTDYDQLQITGGLNITASSGGYTIDINGLTASNVLGSVPNFSNTTDYAWKIATTDGISNYSASDFTLATTNFAGNNPLGSGTFAIHEGSDSVPGVTLDGNANDLYLTFIAGPTQTFTYSAPTNPVNAHVSSTVVLSGTLSNTGSGNLAASLSSAGTLFVSSLGSNHNPVVNGTPATITGTINTGSTAGPQGWQVNNHDATATNPTASISGIVNVYDYANATYTGGTLAFGNVHVGGSLSNQTVAFGNQTVTNASYQDLLDVSATTGNAKVTATGFTGLGASGGGGTTNNLTFSVSPATAGNLASTANLTLTSNASVEGLSNGSATVVGSPASITTTGGVYDYANAKYTGGTLTFGNVRVASSPANQTVAFGNQTVTNASYQDLLDVSATTGNAKVTATGFTGLGASTGGATTNNLSFAASTATAGNLASTASLTLTSNASVEGLSNGSATVVGSPGSITTTGGVYDYANPTYTGGTLAFGIVHVGQSVSSQNVAITNTVITSASYQDNLTVSATTGNAAVSATGYSGQVAGAAAQNLTFAVNTASAGSLASTATLTLLSVPTVGGLDTGHDVTPPASISTSGQVNYYAQPTFGLNNGTPGSGLAGNLTSSAPLDSVNGSTNTSYTLTLIVPAGSSSATLSLNNSNTYSTSYQDAIGTGSTFNTSALTGNGTFTPANFSVGSNIAVGNGQSNLTLTYNPSGPTSGVQGAGSFTLTPSSYNTSSATPLDTITVTVNVESALQTLNKSYTGPSGPGTPPFGTGSDYVTTWSVQNNGTAGSGNSYAGLQATPTAASDTNSSSVPGGGYGPFLGGLSAQILAGYNSGTYTSGAAANVQMTFRDRFLTETEGTGTAPSPLQHPWSPLIGNVLQLTGLGTGAQKSYTAPNDVAGVGANTPYFGADTVVENKTDVFALQMNYDPALLGNEHWQAGKGAIYLAWLAPAGFGDLAAPQWQNAVTGNFDGSGNQDGAHGFDYATNYQGSFDSFVAYLDSINPNGDFSGDPTVATLTTAELNDILGSWGVDTTNHEVWAVINHNSDFAPVPEPSSLLLAALGLLGVVGYQVRRRRK